MYWRRPPRSPPVRSPGGWPNRTVGQVQGVSGIVDAREDDAPRLNHAHWRKDHGDPNRAELTVHGKTDQMIHFLPHVVLAEGIKYCSALLPEAAPTNRGDVQKEL